MADPNGLFYELREDDRVVVLLFEDHSGREELASFGRMAAEWLTEGLVRAELGQVVPTQTIARVLRALPAGDLRPRLGTPQVRRGVLVSRSVRIAVGPVRCRVGGSW